MVQHSILESLEGKGSPTHQRVVLLIEDNPDDEMLARRAFSKHKVDSVVTAHDGAEALDYLFQKGEQTGRYERPMPSIVLLDLKLPKINGLEVLRQIRSHVGTKLLPVIILSNSTEPQDIFNSYDLGANSYIRKPVDFSQFMDVVGKLRGYWLELNELPRVND